MDHIAQLALGTVDCMAEKLETKCGSSFALVLRCAVRCVLCLRFPGHGVAAAELPCGGRGSARLEAARVSVDGRKNKKDTEILSGDMFARTDPV